MYRGIDLDGVSGRDELDKDLFKGINVWKHVCQVLSVD